MERTCLICFKSADLEDSYEARSYGDGLPLGIHHQCLKDDLIRLREKQGGLIFKSAVGGPVRVRDWHLTSI